MIKIAIFVTKIGINIIYYLVFFKTFYMCVCFSLSSWCQSHDEVFSKRENLVEIRLEKKIPLNIWLTYWENK